MKKLASNEIYKLIPNNKDEHHAIIKLIEICKNSFKFSLPNFACESASHD